MGWISSPGRCLLHPCGHLIRHGPEGHHDADSLSLVQRNPWNILLTYLRLNLMFLSPKAHTLLCRFCNTTPLLCRQWSARQNHLFRTAGSSSYVSYHRKPCWLLCCLSFPLVRACYDQEMRPSFCFFSQQPFSKCRNTWMTVYAITTLPGALDLSLYQHLNVLKIRQSVWENAEMIEAKYDLVYSSKSSEVNDGLSLVEIIRSRPIDSRSEGHGHSNQVSWRNNKTKFIFVNFINISVEKSCPPPWATMIWKLSARCRSYPSRAAGRTGISSTDVIYHIEVLNKECILFHCNLSVCQFTATDTETQLKYYHWAIWWTIIKTPDIAEIAKFNVLLIYFCLLLHLCSNVQTLSMLACTHAPTSDRYNTISLLHFRHFVFGYCQWKLVCIYIYMLHWM